MDNAALTQQPILDNEHLKLLSVFHYVKAGISAFFACIPIIQGVFGPVKPPVLLQTSAFVQMLSGGRLWTALRAWKLNRAPLYPKLTQNE